MTAQQRTLESQLYTERARLRGLIDCRFLAKSVRRRVWRQLGIVRGLKTACQIMNVTILAPPWERDQEKKGENDAKG